MKLALILSNDWELFGDGSGDFFEIQHKPTRRLMETCERHGAKLTLMAEVGQQFAYRQLSKEDRMAADITRAWDDQAKDAIQRGHDVQLHWHPQWTGARFVDGRWELKLKNWSLASLDRNTRLQGLQRGKKYLDELLGPLRPNYRCIGFRAGGYCLQPSRESIEDLVHTGLQSDSSVHKGGHLDSPIGSYDFRSAWSDALPWMVNPEDINKPAKSKDMTALLEIPIYCETSWAPLRRLANMISVPAPERRRSSERRRLDCESYPTRRSPVKSNDATEKLNRILRPTETLLDYVYLEPTRAVRMLKTLHNRFARHEGILPVMSIGHVKNMWFEDDAEDLLRLARAEMGSNLIFWTYQEAIEYILSNPQGLADFMVFEKS